MSTLTYMQNLVGGNRRTGSGQKLITQSDLARKLDITRQNVSLMIKKPIRAWGVGQVEKVAEALGMEVTDIIKQALKYERDNLIFSPAKSPKQSK